MRLGLGLKNCVVLETFTMEKERESKAAGVFLSTISILKYSVRTGPYQERKGRKRRRMGTGTASEESPMPAVWFLVISKVKTRGESPRRSTSRRSRVTFVLGSLIVIMIPISPPCLSSCCSSSTVQLSHKNTLDFTTNLISSLTITQLIPLSFLFYNPLPIILSVLEFCLFFSKLNTGQQGGWAATAQSVHGRLRLRLKKV